MRRGTRHAGGRRAAPAFAIAVAGALLGTSLVAPASAGEDAAAWFGRRFESVVWDGARAVSGEALSAASGWRRGATFDSLAWDLLAERVARRYAEDGYLAARVERVHLTPEGDGLAARAEIVEGPRYRVGEIRIHGGDSEEEVRAALGISSGEPWSAARLERALAGLVERYRREARPFTRAHVRRLWTEEDRAHLEIVIVESDTVWVDSVRVEGLVTTAPALVHRLARPLAGSPYAPEEAEHLRRRLADLGVFTTVSGPRLESASARRVVLVYEAEERRANAATGVLGYQGRNTSPAGMAELVLGNIAGTARQAELGWEGLGSAGSRFHAAYREPFLPLWGARAGATFDHELYDTSYVRTRGQLEIGTPGGRAWEGALGFALERVVQGGGGGVRSDRREISSRVGLGRLVEEGRHGAPSGRRIALRGAWATTRESVGAAESGRGVLWTGELAAALVARAGGSRHLRLALDGRARSAAGQALSPPDRFPLGGVETLRGYREDAFRTARYALLRSEFALAAGPTRPFLFLDQAVFAAPDGSASTGELATRYRVGYGAGLSQRTAAGRLGLVLAWGEGTEPMDAKLHLAFATRF